MENDGPGWARVNVPWAPGARRDLPVRLVRQPDEFPWWMNALGLLAGLTLLVCSIAIAMPRS